MGCLVQVPWSRFIITYVILANVKWIVRAELRQLQTCTLFKTVPWCCADILLGWLELGSQDSVGHLLPWLWVADGDTAVLQVPGRASAVSKSKIAAF